MAFDVAEWKRRLGARLLAWRGLAQGTGASAYGALCGMTLWPAVEAARGGDAMMVGAALGSVAAGVGSNLVAGHLHDWMKRATGEDDVAALAAAAALHDPALRDALDAILEQLDAVAQAQQALASIPRERDAFVTALREELRALNNLPRFEVVLGGASVRVGRDIKDSVVVVGSHVNVSVQRGAGESKEAVAAHALPAYWQHLWNQYAPLPLRGLDLRTSDPGSGEGVGLAQVYVGLDTATLVEAAEPHKRGKRAERGTAAEPEKKRRPLSVLEATLRERRLVLLGEPGSGKSTFLNFVTLCLAAHGLRKADGWLARLPGWAEARALPIPVVLRDFVRWLPDGAAEKPKARHVLDFIKARLDDACLGAAAPALEEALNNGQAVVFLDGLDEVPTDDQRQAVRDAVAAFAERYKASRFVVTCRTLSYQDRAWQLAGWPAFTLARFDEEKIRTFIGAWYDELARLHVVSESAGQALAEGLATAVGRRGLADLAPNPLLLTQMALVHTHEGQLPDARAALYEKTVELLLWRWEAVKAQDAAPGLRQLLDEAGCRDQDLVGALSALAFEAHRANGADGETLADISEAQLEDALRELHPSRSKDWAGRVIAVMKLRAGLLIERAPHVYAFPHRTFQEYLAGRHLAVQTDFAAQAARLLAEGAFWREVVLLAVGRLVFVSGDVGRPLLLAAELCVSDDVADEVGARAAWRAGEVLAEIGTQRLAASATGRELARRVPRALTRVIRCDELEPVERAVAGEVLARLGDPRFRADAWFLPDEPLLGFVEIPAGPFRMGSDKARDPEAFDDEQPEHEVTLPRYFIARFPVTVAQFRAFVDDGGRVEYDFALRGPATSPTYWVMWREALAYAEWLTAKLRAWEGAPEPLAGLLRGGTDGKPWRVTLPSEAEWEKAARGSDGRKYPWGNELLDKSRANYDQTGIGAPSAVGCFPRGASPYRVEELSGNLWEWMRSLKRPYPCDLADEREDLRAPDDKPRAIRGGAFADEPALVRAAFRNWFVYAHHTVGFRVVVSPFTSEL